MKILPADTHVAFVFQGVQQNTDRQLYRTALTESGEMIYIDATPPWKYEITKGRFETRTIDVIRVEEDGTRHIIHGREHTMT